MKAALQLLIGCCVCVAVSHAYSASDVNLYGVPISGRGIDGIDQRTRDIVRFAACGNEEWFFSKVEDTAPGEDTTVALLGKLLFGQVFGPEGKCKWTYESDENAKKWAQNSARLTSTICATATGKELELDWPCIRAQANAALRNIRVHGSAGSSDLPCIRGPGFSSPLPTIGTTEGEWDVAVRDLSRILWMDRRMAGYDATNGFYLDLSTRKIISEQLLTLDGGPAPETYSLGDCGNDQHATGSPEERADDREWSDSVLSDVGDVLDWLKNFLFRLALFTTAIAIAAPVAIAAAGPVGAAAVATLVVGGTELLAFGQIAETENHLLMINTAIYLKDQELLEDLRTSHPAYPSYVADKAAVREWLLKDLQRITVDDFSEYNARGYQRYSISALRNLFDYADDAELHKAAQNVLDLASAKMAVGSSHSRRLAPFRRKVAAVATIEPTPGKFNGFFDFASLGEHQVASMLYYAGDFAEMPVGVYHSDNAEVSVSAARVDLTLAAASRYRPPLPVLALVSDNRGAYEQRIRHASFEHYVRRPGFLLTAGGVTAPVANPLQMTGMSITGAIVNTIPIGKDDDRGTGLPTTLMMWSDNASDIGDLIRIDGRREPAGDGAIYDHNLCVSGGFACGYNVQTPPRIESCFTGATGQASQWTFLDTTACPAGFASERRVFVARYIESCVGDSSGDCASPNGNVGFLEAVDATEAPPGLTLDTFAAQVIANNAPYQTSWRRAIASRIVLAGDYHRFDGTMLRFSTAGHQLDSDTTGIDQERLALWPRAAGGPLSNPGPGRFAFRNPITGAGFEIDMSNWNVPNRVDF